MAFNCLFFNQYSVEFGKCGGFFENFEERKQVLIAVKQGE